MTANAKTKESYKRVESILVSQPQPARSPYFELEEKFGIKIDFRPFIHVEAVPEKEFRRTRIRPDEFNCVIFTSLNSIEHFFRMCEDMRIKMPMETKYFCLTEAIANYLQKFILYRKRKVFFGKRVIQDMHNALMKHRKTNKFIVPCSNLGSVPVINYLKEKKFNFQEAMMYRTVSSDLSDLSNITYDVLVFFSPLGIKSLYENFPDFKQNETRIAVFGNSTSNAVLEKGLTINIEAPSKEFPSMTMALKHYLNQSNK
ncbi:MAG: uroporphyrinogen-III synthase [Saprospirales bacterium]|jgi:uroporphyrinogen-III synthase|nr:MAG: uroporphyrinogen-III synthase [Saprospirales bacterium]